MFHVRMIDVTLPDACTLLGGLGGVLGGGACSASSMTQVCQAVGISRLIFFQKETGHLQSGPLVPPVGQASVQPWKDGLGFA